MAYKIGIDVGGTFTDFLLMADDGSFEVYKASSTPQDPSIAVLNGLTQMADGKGIPLSEFLPQVSLIAHGTTITTNAVLTGNVAKTGLVTTEGHRDWLQTRRGLKPSCYDAKEAPPEPIVQRKLRRPVKERVAFDGKELLPLSIDDVLDAARVFRKDGVQAVAVCFLNSFASPDHEKKAKEILEQELPGVYISTSSDVLPQVRIYERGSTTVFNAAVGPILRSYINNLLGKLETSGFQGVLLIMQSNGGMMSPQVAMDFAVNTLLSGPAGGATSGVFFGDIHDCKNVITMDMGGTSFDVCLIREREPEISSELDVAMFRMAAPSIGIYTVGAGGGSIAHVDHDGMFRVGPKSAGAFPGPACYATGGTEPAVTDADLLLGYLDPDYFLGGTMKIDPELSREALKTHVTDKLNLSEEEAAWGVYKIVNSNMAQAVRVTSINKGYDPRSAFLVTAGGAGPVHACAIADDLEAPMILVPKISSVFCATGMLISDIKHDFVRVLHMILDPKNIDVPGFNARMEEMKEEALDVLKREGIAADRIQLNYWADIRYEGQFNEIATPVPMKNGSRFAFGMLTELNDAFNKRHDTLFGYSLPGFTQELMSLRLSAVGTVDKPDFRETGFVDEDVSRCIKGHRNIYWDGTWLDAAVYDGPQMGRGHKLVGPAIIEEPTTTIVVPPHWQLFCDRYSNYVLNHVGMSLEESFRLVRWDTCREEQAAKA
ncbi:MAG: hydantoinase/oxoprolinase family protein [Gaiellales bacterium]|nr:hydantoinase/oxoprolinase family protein [Gaiellales bacterium]